MYVCMYEGFFVLSRYLQSDYLTEVVYVHVCSCNYFNFKRLMLDYVHVM